MGATLAGCRPVAYDDLADITDADAERALCLWVNSPANPIGRARRPRAPRPAGAGPGGSRS